MKRDKERTKQKILDAVAAILREGGSWDIGVNKVSREAGVDKQLIYRYFGGMDGLIAAFVSNNDLWHKVVDQVSSRLNGHGGKDLHALANLLLEKQFDLFYRDASLRQLMLWSVSEKNQTAIAEMILQREKTGVPIIRRIEEQLTTTKCKYSAVAALLLAGIYFLTLRAHTHRETFCGIDLNDEFGQLEIKKAIRFINESVFNASGDDY